MQRFISLAFLTLLACGGSTPSDPGPQTTADGSAASASKAGGSAPSSTRTQAANAAGGAGGASNAEPANGPDMTRAGAGGSSSEMKASAAAGKNSGGMSAMPMSMSMSMSAPKAGSSASSGGVMASATAGAAAGAGAMMTGTLNGMGSCCDAHDDPGCGDAELQVCVCEKLPSCCTEAWTSACAFIVTMKFCQPGVRECVCGTGDKQWGQAQCCDKQWGSTCESVAEQKCGAAPGCR